MIETRQIEAEEIKVGDVVMIPEDDGSRIVCRVAHVRRDGHEYVVVNRRYWIHVLAGPIDVVTHAGREV